MNKAALLIKGLKVMKSLTDAKQLPAADRYFKLTRMHLFGQYYGAALMPLAYHRSPLYLGFCEMRDAYHERNEALTGGTNNGEVLES